MLTVQAPPVHAPLQPPNSEPALGAALSVTLADCGKEALQVAPQLIPEGAEVTVPEPAPALVTVSALCATEKTALTLALALSVNVQVVDVPVQPPLQPVKLAPAAGAAVNVTTVFCARLAAQLVEGQLIPPVLETTFPEPITLTLSERLPGGSGAKLAVTVVFAFMTSWHCAVPVHPPLHPLNCEFASGTAISCTPVPWLKASPQSLLAALQSMPAGIEVTLPPPVPPRTTDKVNAFWLKVACTVVSASIVTVQVAVPLQPPPVQPTNCQPAAGDAVSVTGVPAA
jgi:hypothetical protein